jgi:hypothetical protein
MVLTSYAYLTFFGVALALNLAGFNEMDAPLSDAALMSQNEGSDIHVMLVLCRSSRQVVVTEVYRSFVDGYPLESAVVEARKALSVEHWEWSVYSLMAKTARLDHLTLPSPLPRSDPVG